MFAIFSTAFLSVELIKTTDVECQPKSVSLFVHVLNILCWHSLASFLDVSSPVQECTVPRSARCRSLVSTSWILPNLIERAKTCENPNSLIFYHVINATDEQQLLSLGEGAFDSTLSKMALFDMADIKTLFGTLPKLLKPGGTFVFSLTHPAFNNASSMHVAEEMDLEGESKTV
jgi:hypothetical protein